MKIAFVFAMSMCIMAGTANAAEKADAYGAFPMPKTARAQGWTFSRQTDKMTDKVRCMLSAPDDRAMLSLFNGNLNVLTEAPMAQRTDDVFVFRARVDKNEQTSLPFRFIATNIAVVDVGSAKPLLDQMQSGKSLLVRMGTERFTFERQYELRTFASAYSKYTACVAETDGK